jgi:hypothetical protein
MVLQDMNDAIIKAADVGHCTKHSMTIKVDAVLPVT